MAGDFTVTKVDDETFWVIGSGMAERYHQRFFNAVPLPGGTTFRSLTESTCGFNVAGPEARALLQRLTNTSLETADFKFMRSRRIEIAGVRALALRVSFTGDLGWELHCAEADQTRLYEALLEAGKAFDAGPVGSRALMSLRLEKGYGSWGREYSPEYWPHEVGLERLCKTTKDFLNKAALLEVLDQPARGQLMLLALDGDAASASNADASGSEPVFKDGIGVGHVTSGAYGYHVDQSLALAYLTDVAPGDSVEVMLLGLPHPAKVLDAPPFDPEGKRLRA